MQSLDKRMTRLEETVEKHLIESGEIRGDLKWLKKGYWVLVGLGVTFAGTGVAVVLQTVFRVGK